MLKCPLDLWSYQEILHEVRPELIIETGTYQGGSALFLASICDLLGEGEVLTIDVDRREGRPRHPRITYLTGSSTSNAILRQVRRRAKGASRVLVILDSGHAKDHVLAELDAYAPLVTPGSYLIVEDTNLNGHPVDSDHGPGPAEAVAEFLEGNDAFVRDESQREVPADVQSGRLPGEAGDSDRQLPWIASAVACGVASGSAVAQRAGRLQRDPDTARCRGRSTSSFSDPSSRRYAATHPRTS